MSAIMDAQRELAQRLLAEMENPVPVKPEIAAKAMAFTAQCEAALDEAAGHYYTSSRAYVAAELSRLEDGEDGCVIWTGYFTATGDVLYPKQNGVHALCGHGHWQVARAMLEERLGRVLDQYSELVVGTCATNLNSDVKACVSPDHHELRERGQ